MYFSSFAGVAQVTQTPEISSETLEIPETPLLENNLPELNEEALKAAKDAGFEEGYAKGYNEGFTACKNAQDQATLQYEEKIQEALTLIANRIVIAAELHSAYNAEQKKTFASLIMAISRKIAGEALQANPYYYVESVLAQCNVLIAGEPAILIKVAPLLCEGLRQRLEVMRPLLGGFKGEITLVEDHAVMQNDCVIEWKNGYAEYNSEVIWQKIETIISDTPLRES